MDKVKVLVKAGIDDPYSSSVYFFLRWRDTEGKGWVRTSMSLLTSFFNISRRSIIRRLHKGVKKGYYFFFEVHHDLVFVKYKSYHSLRKLQSNFASGFIPVSSLSSVSEFKRVLYGLAIQRQQAACEKAIHHKESSSKRIMNPFFYLNSYSAKGCDFRKDDKLFMKSFINCIGASQISLAQYLHKSRQTLVKWCSHFPSLKIWKRLPSLQDFPSPDIYEVYKVDKLGRKRRVHYKRMPNYYFVDFEAIPESKHLFHSVTSPALLFKSAQSKQHQVDQDFKYLSSLKKHPGSKLSDKLLFWFSSDKMKSLFSACCQLLEIDVPSSYIDQCSSSSLADMIELTYNDSRCSDSNKEIILMMIRRLKKHKSPYPPYLNYKP